MAEWVPAPTPAAAVAGVTPAAGGDSSAAMARSRSRTFSSWRAFHRCLTYSERPSERVESLTKLAALDETALPSG